MSQRAALLISTMLTVLTLLAGIGLGARIMSADADTAASSSATDADGASDVSLDQDRQYREAFDLIQASNAALAASYDRIAGLLDDVEQLRAQNAILREREKQYQQRLAEANSRLERLGQDAIVIPAPSDASTADASPAEAPESAADSQTEATADALAAGPVRPHEADLVPEAAVAPPAAASRSSASAPPVVTERVAAAPPGEPEAAVAPGPSTPAGPTGGSLFAPAPVRPFEVQRPADSPPGGPPTMVNAPAVRAEGPALGIQSAVPLLTSAVQRAVAAQPVGQTQSPNSTRRVASSAKHSGHDGDDDKDDRRDGRSQSRERRGEHERD